MPAEEAEEQRKLAKMTVDALLNLPLPPEEPERVPVPSIELDPSVRPSLLLHDTVWWAQFGVWLHITTLL